MIRIMLVACCLLVVPAFALTGREVIDSAQQKNGFSTWKDRKVVATMSTYSGENLTRARDVDISEQTDPRGEHRTFMAFTSPADVQGTRFLHLSPRGARDQQWLYAPVTRRVRRLAESQRDENFFGADLSYRDLELLVRIQQWNDDESTATLDREETIGGAPCHVVTLAPKNDEFPTYSKYVLAFDTTNGYLRRVDMFDKDGNVFKRVLPRAYERAGAYVTAMESDIETLPNNTKTVFRIREIKYDVGIGDGTFAVSNLDR